MIPMLQNKSMQIGITKLIALAEIRRYQNEYPLCYLSKAKSKEGKTSSYCTTEHGKTATRLILVRTLGQLAHCSMWVRQFVL
jgi:predicted transcriptional regulator